MPKAVNGRFWLLLALFTNVLNNAVHVTAELSCTGQNLTNQVAYEDTSVSFKRLNNGQLVQWDVISSSDFFNKQRTISNSDGTVLSPFTSTYAVENSQLVVLNTAVNRRSATIPYATAGLYIIKYQNPDCTYGANLIVIKNGPVCSCDTRDRNNIKLSCSVDFASAGPAPNTPIFTWSYVRTNDRSTEVRQESPVPDQISSYMKRSSSMYKISRTHPILLLGQYKCQLTFSPTRFLSKLRNYVTKTAPDFSATCSLRNCGVF